VPSSKHSTLLAPFCRRWADRLPQLSRLTQSFSFCVLFLWLLPFLLATVATLWRSEPDSRNDGPMSVQQMLSAVKRSATQMIKKLVTKVRQVKTTTTTKKGPKDEFRSLNAQPTKLILEILLRSVLSHLRNLFAVEVMELSRLNCERHETQLTPIPPPQMEDHTHLLRPRNEESTLTLVKSRPNGTKPKSTRLAHNS